MAFYCLTMLRIALRLAEHDAAYDDDGAEVPRALRRDHRRHDQSGMWDDEDGFFYDQLLRPDGSQRPLRVRSMVGRDPAAGRGLHRRRDEALAARATATSASPTSCAAGRWTRRPGRAGLRRTAPGGDELLLTVLDPERLRRVLLEVLERGLVPLALRPALAVQAPPDAPVLASTSTVRTFRVDYEPAESHTAMYGGNSNWRGPVWFPINHLVIEALERYHMYLGDDFQVECPTGSRGRCSTWARSPRAAQAADPLFLPGPDGRRPVFGTPKVPDRPALERFAPFLRVLPRRQRRRARGLPPDRLDRLVADLIIGRMG